MAASVAPKWTVDIKDLQRRYSLSLRQLKAAARCVLKEEKVKSAQLSLVLVTAGAIRRMNRAFLGRDRATDVLAFDMSDVQLSYKRKKVRALEGEVVISVMTASRNAKQFKNSLEQEVTLYVIHGILHLLGYDDHKPSESRRMRCREQQLLALCAQKGYCAP